MDELDPPPPTLNAFSRSPMGLFLLHFHCVFSGAGVCPTEESLIPLAPHLLTRQLQFNRFLILEPCFIPWFGWKRSISVCATQPMLVYSGQFQHESQVAPGGHSYLVLQLLDSHLEEDAYPGDSSPVMMQVHGPNVLTELLDEGHNFIAVKLRADNL